MQGGGREEDVEDVLEVERRRLRRVNLWQTLSRFRGRFR